MNPYRNRLFDEAKNFVIRFGEYRDQTIDQIARDTKGLKYLDWLVGEDWVKGNTRKMLEIYLKDETIVKELEAII